MNSKDTRQSKYQKHGYLIDEICGSYPHLSKELEARIREFSMKFPVEYKFWYHYEMTPAIKKLQKERYWSHSTTPEFSRKGHSNGYQSRDRNGYGRSDQMYHSLDRSYHVPKHREQQFSQKRLSDSVSSRSQSRIVQGESPGDMCASDFCYKKFHLPHSVSKVISNRCLLFGQGKHLSVQLYPVNIPHSEYLSNLEQLKELMPFEDKKCFYEYLQSHIDQTRHFSEKMLYQLVLLQMKLKGQTEPNDVSELLLNEYRKIQGDQFLNYRFPTQLEGSSRSHVVSRSQYVSRDSLSPLSPNANESVMSREQFISQPQDSFSAESLAISREQFISQDISQSQGMSRDEFMSQDRSQDHPTSSNPRMTREQFMSQDSEEQREQNPVMSREQFISQDQQLSENMALPSRQQFISQGPSMSREQYMSQNPESQVMSREQFVSQGRLMQPLFPPSNELPSNAQVMSRNQFMSQDQGILDNSMNSLSLQKQDHDKVMHRLRKLLLNGSKHKALQCAIENRDWVNALLIASSMDEPTFDSVNAMYVQSLNKNDPLRTCLQVMFGLNVDYKYSDDWGIHLAAILNNVSDMSLIIRFSDMFGTVGDICGQHFCFLSARVNPSSYVNQSSKYVLLGAEKTSFERHVPIKSIILTMAYDNTLPHLQFYKYSLALNYVKMGMYELALSLLKNVANVFLSKHVTEVSHQYSLLLYVYDLSLRLYSRVNIQHAVWINRLAELISALKQSEIEHEPVKTMQEPLISHEETQNIPQFYNSSEPSSHSYYSGLEPETISNHMTEPATQHIEPISNYESLPISFHTNKVEPISKVPLETAPSFVSTVETKQAPSFYVPTYDPMSSQSGYELPSYTVENNAQNTNQEESTEDLGVPNVGSISITSRFTFGDDTDSNEQKTNKTVNSEPKEEIANKTKLTKPEVDKSSNKSSSNSRWLSFLNFAKPKNQMILPDDTKPSIIWDKEKKKWVNINANNDDETNAPVPPPKASEILPVQNNMPSQTPPASMNIPNNNSMIGPTPIFSNISQNGSIQNGGIRKNKTKYINVLAQNR